MSRPPVAPIKPHKVKHHGKTVVDDYFWLRKKRNPKVLAYLKAENRYCAAKMRHTQKLEARLYREMKARIKETDQSAPYREGDYLYYRRTVKGKQYAIYCRRRGSMKSREEVILDVNRLARGNTYCYVADLKVSSNQNLLAYTVDTTGYEKYVLRIKNLKTGKLLRDRIPAVAAGIEWAEDHRTLFYTVHDASMRPFKLYRHRLGEPVKKDTLVYHEKDPAFYLGLDKSRSKAFLFFDLGSMDTSEIWFLDAKRPEGRFRCVQRRQAKVEYSLDHSGQHFYILTNERALNFKVMKAPIASLARKNWKTFIPHDKNVYLEDFDLFRDYIAISKRERGCEGIRIHDLRTGRARDIRFPEPVFSIFDAPNQEFDTELLRFEYGSLVTPASVFDYNMRTGKRELIKEEEVKGGYKPAQYRTERLFARATDGARIPISIVYSKKFPPRKSRPLLLYAYGSYADSVSTDFDSDRLCLLDRGVTFAIAHVRGGSEMGRQWYDDGRLRKKLNTFTDFIACAEHLIRKKYTAANRLVINGASAGGLLVGAVLNLRPDLFHAALAEVPFVDAINTMMDSSIPLTVIEYDQWGNPNERAAYNYIRKYSPYENVRPQDYPHILITAGLNDPRVPYWEPAKWAARLRREKSDDNLLLLKTKLTSGHSGASGRYEGLEETAFLYAFILDCLGIKK